MLPITLTQTGTGSSTTYNVNSFVSGVNIGFGCIATGTVTYTVQHTFDGTNWFDHPDVASETTNADGNYAFPVDQIRVTVTAGTGSVAMTIIQAGVNA